MKQRIAIAAVALMAVSALAAGLNTYDSITYQELLAPATISGNSTGSVFNLGPYKGIAAVVLTVSDNSLDGGTNTITIQHSTASGGTYTTLTNEAGTAVSASIVGSAAGDTSVIKLDTSVAHQYIRAVGSPNGATGTVAAVIVLPPK